jgi:hypothetical protein
MRSPLTLVEGVVYPAFSVPVICVVQGPLVMNITSSLCALHWPLCGTVSALCLLWAPDQSICLLGSRTSVKSSALFTSALFSLECLGRCWLAYLISPWWPDKCNIRTTLRSRPQICPRARSKQSAETVLHRGQCRAHNDDVMFIANGPCTTPITGTEKAGYTTPSTNVSGERMHTHTKPENTLKWDTSEGKTNKACRERWAGLRNLQW